MYNVGIHHNHSHFGFLTSVLSYNDNKALRASAI